MARVKIDDTLPDGVYPADGTIGYPVGTGVLDDPYEPGVYPVQDGQSCSDHMGYETDPEPPDSTYDGTTNFINCVSNVNQWAITSTPGLATGEAMDGRWLSMQITASASPTCLGPASTSTITYGGNTYPFLQPGGTPMDEYAVNALIAAGEGNLYFDDTRNAWIWNAPS